jgi:hypothetical protein
MDIHVTEAEFFQSGRWTDRQTDYFSDAPKRQILRHWFAGTKLNEN